MVQNALASLHQRIDQRGHKSGTAFVGHLHKKPNRNSTPSMVRERIWRASTVLRRVPLCGGR